MAPNLGSHRVKSGCDQDPNHRASGCDPIGHSHPIEQITAPEVATFRPRRFQRTLEWPAL